MHLFYTGSLDRATQIDLEQGEYVQGSLLLQIRAGLSSEIKENQSNKAGRAGHTPTAVATVTGENVEVSA